MERPFLIRALIRASWGFAFLFILFAGFLTYWSYSDPAKTCLSCHEISQSFGMWEISAHRNIECSQCHGTALSEGLHSLTEKFGMLASHVSEDYHDNIRLNEQQVLAVMERCAGCHQTEFSNWMSGGHSATYAAIFLNEKHNSVEQPHADCLRCHGMFYEGNIKSLVDPLSTEGPWKLLPQDIADRPTMPCLACHQIHMKGEPKLPPDYTEPAFIAAKRPKWNPGTGFYSRLTGSFFRTDQLPQLELHDGKNYVIISEDPRQKVCIQCHAPNAWHEAGTSDDRTPRGVHEGISCTACHELHSNNSQASCDNCHPALSNCGIPVKTMNTTYEDPNSPNNIHFVACKDCHENADQLKRRFTLRSLEE